MLSLSSYVKVLMDCFRGAPATAGVPDFNSGTSVVLRVDSRFIPHQYVWSWDGCSILTFSRKSLAECVLEDGVKHSTEKWLFF